MKANFSPYHPRKNPKTPKRIKAQWPKYMEKIEARKAESLVLNTQTEKTVKETLEKSPVRDVFDFSTEEFGYFVGPDGKRVKTVFPR